MEEMSRTFGSRTTEIKVQGQTQYSVPGTVGLVHLYFLVQYFVLGVQVLCTPVQSQLSTTMGQPISLLFGASRVLNAICWPRQKVCGNWTVLYSHFVLHMGGK